MTPNGDIKLIDMRGYHYDHILTMVGDPVYDLAKVYQSLLGYDIVLLLNRLPTNKEMGMLSDLRQVFGINSPAKLQDVQLVTMSHLFTLIPLHGNTLIRKWAYNIVSKYITLD